MDIENDVLNCSVDEDDHLYLIENHGNYSSILLTIFDVNQIIKFIQNILLSENHKFENNLFYQALKT